MLRFLHRHLLIRAIDSGIRRRNTFRYWKELEASQWESREELERLQFHALGRLTAHAFENCPYYRQQWCALGIGPDMLLAPGDFLRFPVIDRETIWEHRREMRAVQPELRLISKSTGGSSGVPLHFDLDSGSNERRMAAWHRGYGWAGAEPGTKQLYLWGVSFGGSSWWRRRKNALYNRVYRRLIWNTFELDDKRYHALLRRLNRYRPDVVVAYTNPVYSFARWLDEHRLRPYSPKAIVIGAEKLHDFQRKLLESVFRAPVFETYGSREFMLIGAECPKHEGLHLTMENLLVEVLDDDGRPTPAGEEGNVVVTDLYNFGMPFVRYVTGDRATAGWSHCSCGRGLPLLTQLVGRRLDLLQTPDGRRIPGEFFPHLMKEFPAIRRFQVVQTDTDRIELRVVLTGTWRDADRRRLADEVEQVAGPSVRFEVVPVDDIPLTPAGKLRVVVNECQPDPSSRPSAGRGTRDGEETGSRHAPLPYS